MYGSDQQTTWRNIARHEESFNDLLYVQLRKTPWWLISIAFHGLIILILFYTPFDTGGASGDSRLKSRMEDDMLDDLKEEVKPDIEETKPIEQDEEQIEDPVIKDAKVSDHNETDNDMPFEESLGDKDFISDAPFDGPSTNAAIGIGGGAGGAFGGRGGHRNLRAMGGGQATEGAVDLGLEWLKNHQDPDGLWDCDGYMAQCKLQEDRQEGAQVPEADPGPGGLLRPPDRAPLHLQPRDRRARHGRGLRADGLPALQAERPARHRLRPQGAEPIPGMAVRRAPR
ncbi:MAG: hypothetical protein ACYS99_10245 [Planctomycetota bacterium]|jgi:hypothetical protein